jgi:hypothetical protein
MSVNDLMIEKSIASSEKLFRVIRNMQSTYQVVAIIIGLPARYIVTRSWSIVINWSEAIHDTLAPV